MHRLLSCRTFAAILILLLAGCTLGREPNIKVPAAVADLQEIIESLERVGFIPQNASQVLLVTSEASTYIYSLITPFEKNKGKWSIAMPPIHGVTGRGGFADPGGKKEGDGKTPSGVFRLQTAFGYMPTAPTRMTYRQVTAEDLWVDDIDAPDYNRWVKRGETAAASFEELRRGDELYKYGVIIEYNTESVIRGNGSAIFLHVWSGAGQPTAGCVAVAEPDLLRILGWLDPAKNPVMVMGTEKILRKMAANVGS